MPYSAIPTPTVRAYQRGAPDAFDRPAERAISSGAGNPCRHCLCNIPQGAEMLILAHRPFPAPQPYAEIGPIFLCASECDAGGGGTLPPILTTSPDYLLKGYSADNRIVYGTGRIVTSDQIASYSAETFANPDVAYIHVRSARNNCYQLRMDRP